MELVERNGSENNGCYVNQVAVSLQPSTFSSIRTTRTDYHLSHLATLRQVINLVHNNDIHCWLEGRSDSLSKAKNLSVLNEFLSDQTHVHPMWRTVLEGDVEGISSWICEIKTCSLDIDETDCNGLNALHYALVFKQTKLVELLLEEGAAPVCPTSSMLLPLQLAIMGPAPFVEAIDILCSYKNVVNSCLETSKWGTALDQAVKEENLEAVVILLRYGADPRQCWNEKTSLERAITIRNRTIVKAMLEVPSKGNGIDKDILLHVKSCTSGNTRLCHGHTPFAELISELPDIAEIVLNHCIQTKGAPHEEDYEVLFDCSLFENENSSANKCYRALPCTCLFEILSWFRSNNSAPDEMSANDRHFNCFNEKAYDSFEKYHHPLYNVMLSKDSRLLKHPVVQILLEQKLRKFGWLLYYSNLLMYLLLACLLMTFILILPNPTSTECFQIANHSMENILINNCSNFVSSNRRILLHSVKSVTLILVLIRSLLELYQMYSQKVVGYFKSWVNWIELAQCVSLALFLLDVSGSRCFCPTTREWETGIVSLSLTWVVLIVWLQTMHWIGIYVTIMLKIIYSFIKVAVFGLLLIVAFGLSFYMLFYRPPREDDIMETFGSPVRAILAVIPLTAGDISMDSIFYSSESHDVPIGRQYQTLAFIIWLSAVIIMSVLFNNLLVGLAVGEVTSVIEKARITTIKQRIDLVLTLEEHLPEYVHQQVIQKEPITVFPNTIPSACYCIRVIMQFVCVCCSAVFFNTNHFRYWTFIFNPRARKPDKKFEEITRIVEKARFNSSAEEDEHSQPVTKDEVRILLDELKEELKYYDCVMQSLSYR